MRYISNYFVCDDSGEPLVESNTLEEAIEDSERITGSTHDTTFVYSVIKNTPTLVGKTEQNQGEQGVDRGLGGAGVFIPIH